MKYLKSYDLHVWWAVPSYSVVSVADGRFIKNSKKVLKESGCGAKSGDSIVGRSRMYLGLRKLARVLEIFWWKSAVFGAENSTKILYGCFLGRWEGLIRTFNAGCGTSEVGEYI